MDGLKSGGFIRADKFMVSEKYRLELHWESVKYEAKDYCKLVNAYFSGPALSVAEKIQGNDHINLDFFEQYSIITRNAYVAKFSWGDVIYNKDNTITLKDAVISHDKDLHKVPKLHDKDYIVIDTKDHEADVHHFNLVYRSYVVNENFVMYNFRK